MTSLLVLMGDEGIDITLLLDILVDLGSNFGSATTLEGWASEFSSVKGRGWENPYDCISFL